MTENTHSPAVGLESLSRGTSGSNVPTPRYRWMTRAIIPAAILCGMALLLAASAADSLKPAVEVSAASVIERAGESRQTPGTAVVQAAGWIEADPYLIYATALTDGVVREVKVLEGDTVKQGQVLATLVDEDARLALEQAEAEVQSRAADLLDAQARLYAAQTDWDNPVERERAVAVAEARLAEYRATLSQLEAELVAARADVERLQSDYDRIAPLGESEVVSEADVVNARTKLEAQKANAEALKRRHEVVRAQISREEAELTAANETLRLRTEERRGLDVAKAAVARAEAALARSKASLAEVELRMERLHIKSPSDGIVVERFKEPGSKVMLGMDDKTSAVIASLYDPRKLQVRVDVPLADAAKIVVGQRAEIVADVLPDETFMGKVTRILHVADIQKNTLQVKVAIDDPSPLLRPEMLARAKFLAESDTRRSSQATAIYSPTSAIQSGNIYVVTEFDGTHGIVQQRSVSTIGAERDGWIEVPSGLNPGDVVIDNPTEKFRDGQRVRVNLAKD